jgi:hypothetical protein
MTHPPRPFIIEGVLPAHVVALLVGAPGVGKSSAALGWLAQIQAGEPIFGHSSRPTPIVWVSLDRSEDEYYSHLDALGFPRDTFRFFDQTVKSTSIRTIAVACGTRWPGSLIFIDGFARLVPDGRLSDYGIVADFLVETAELARKYNVTFIGCVHTAKAREGQGYSDPRSQVCGSTAWAAFSNLTIVIERKDAKDPSNPVRIVNILTRAEAGDFQLLFQKDPASRGGGFIVYENPGDKDLLEFWLSGVEFDRTVSRKEFLSYASSQTVAERTAERWLEQRISDGQLERVGRGLYRRLRVS